MKFKDIPKFPRSYWQSNMALKDIKRTLHRWDGRNEGLPDNALILNPDFQRGHVWTLEQQISYMEYMLKGGSMGRNIYFNCSTWTGDYTTPIYCVDGLQRLTAAIDFIDNKVPVWGTLYKDFEDDLTWSDADFMFNMLVVKNKRDLLQIYVDLNSGGTPHNPSEIARVKAMIENTPPDETL